MLVLSRKPGERVLVPPMALAVTVLAIEGKAVRLGIAAPEDLAVYREELWQQLCQQTHSPETLAAAGGKRHGHVDEPSEPRQTRSRRRTGGTEHE